MPRCTMTQILFACFILSLMFISTVGRAQNQYVYLVKASDCTQKPVQRALTGFRIRGVKGIITALHGVADSRTITVTSVGGNRGGGRVTIYDVDVPHDLARLSSPAFERLSAQGFEPAPIVNWQSLGQVNVIGYPLGVDLQDLITPLAVGTPPLKTLATLVDAPTRLYLQSRRSPDPSRSVLYLIGFLHPGHSGAPILDQSNRVVAVADGGLQVFSGIGWAIPWKGVRWKPASEEPLLTGLRQKGNAGLFAFDTGTATAEKRIADIQQQVNGIEQDTTQLKQKTNQIAESVAPRRLTDEQNKQLIQILQQGPKGQVYIACTNGDTEAQIFAIQLNNALSAAGWSPIGVAPTIVQGTVYIGLHIQVYSFKTAPAYAGYLQQSLNKIGFFVAGDEMRAPEGEVHLFVGAKP